MNLPGTAASAPGSVVGPTTVSPSRTSVGPTTFSPSRTSVGPTTVSPSRTSVDPTTFSPSRTSVRPTTISPSRTSVRPAMGSVKGADTDKAVGPSKTRLADHALKSIAEAYAAIQYNWDSSCSDSEFGNDHDDNYIQRRKYVLIDLDDGARGGNSNPVQTMPKKVKKGLKEGGHKRVGRKRTVSVQSNVKTSEGANVSDQQQEEILTRSDCSKRGKNVLKKGGQKRVERKRSVSVQSASITPGGMNVSDQKQEEILTSSDCFKKVKNVLKKGGQKRVGRKRSVSIQSAAKSEELNVSYQQQENILPRSDCFKRISLPNRPNEKCLIPVETVVDRSFEKETRDHQCTQLFPGIVPNEAMLSDVGDYSLQEQLILKTVEDKRTNSETVPLSEQHDSMNSDVTCVIVLSDSDEEMDTTESGDGITDLLEVPKRSSNEIQVLMEGTTPVTVPHGGQDTARLIQDLMLLEGNASKAVTHGYQHTSMERKDLLLLEGTTPEAVSHGDQHTSMEMKDLMLLEGTTPEAVPHGDQHTSMEMKDLMLLEGTSPEAVTHGNSRERKDLALMETMIRPDELYSDDEFVIEPNESCDFEIDLSDCNSVRTSDMTQPGARTLFDSTDGMDDGFSSEEESIVHIELQSYFYGDAANQTVVKERSLETQNTSLRSPVMISSDDKKIHDHISISVCGAIPKTEQAPIQNLKSCSEGTSSSSEVPHQNSSPEEMMKTPNVIHVSRHQDEMSSSEEGLSCDGSGSDQRINQTKSLDVHKLLRADPSIRASPNPPVFSDHVAKDTCYEAPQTSQSCKKCQLNFTSAELFLKHFSKVHRNRGEKIGKRKRATNHLKHASFSFGELHWSDVDEKGCPTHQDPQSYDKSELRSSSSEMLQKYSAKVEETGIFKHMRTHSCTICGEVNMSSQALHKHLLMHVGIMSFECEVCGKAFVSASDLRQHLCIHQKHLKNQECNCNEHSVAFSKYARLTHHKSIKHQDEYRHGCKVCGKTFPSAVRLKYHMPVHSWNREFHCSICGKSFKCQRYLDRHMYSHSQDRPFACCVCDKKFKRKQHRDVHEMKHVNFLSNVSNSLFVYNHPGKIPNSSNGIKL